MDKNVMSWVAILGGLGAVYYFLIKPKATTDASQITWANTWNALTPAQQGLVNFISKNQNLSLGDASTSAKTNPLWNQGDAAIQAYLNANS